LTYSIRAVYPNSPTYIVPMFRVWLCLAWKAAAHAGLPHDRGKQLAVLEEVYSDQDSLALFQQMSMQVSADAEMTQMADAEVTQITPCLQAIENKISAVESITRSLTVFGTMVTQMTAAVLELLSPVQRVLIAWTKGMTVAADFELIEFSLLLTNFDFKAMYLCNPLDLPASDGTVTERAAILWSVEKSLHAACLGTMYKDTLHALGIVMQAVMDGLRCQKAGLSPQNRTEQRKIAFTKTVIQPKKQPIMKKKMQEAKSKAASQMSLFENDDVSELETNLALAISDTIDFAFSMPHRKRYLEAARPGIVQLLERYIVNKSFSSAAELLMADRKVKDHFHPDSEFSNSSVPSVVAQDIPPSTGHRRRGECNPGHRRRGQASYNFDKHPFRTRDISEYNNGGGGGSCWACWGRRRRDRRRRTFKRDEYKKAQCPEDSEKNLDDLFETDCSYNGCSSPTPLLYRDVVSPTCSLHDVCYKCGKGVSSEAFCDNVLFKNINAECARKKKGWKIWQRPICYAQSGIVWAAVRIGGRFSEPPGQWCQGTCAKKVAFSSSKTSEPHLRAVDSWYSDR